MGIQRCHRRTKHVVEIRKPKRAAVGKKTKARPFPAVAEFGVLPSAFRWIHVISRACGRVTCETVGPDYSLRACQYRDMTSSSLLCPLRNLSPICVQPHSPSECSCSEASTSCPSPSSVVARQKDRSTDCSDNEQYRDNAT